MRMVLQGVTFSTQKQKVKVTFLADKRRKLYIVREKGQMFVLKNDKFINKNLKTLLK